MILIEPPVSTRKEMHCPFIIRWACKGFQLEPPIASQLFDALDSLSRSDDLHTDLLYDWWVSGLHRQNLAK